MSEPRNQMISIKVSEKEYDFVKTKVAEEGLSISDFIRKKVLTEESISNKLFQYRALRMLSSCVAFVKFVSENKMTKEEQEAFWAEIEKMREELGVS